MNLETFKSMAKPAAICRTCFGKVSSTVIQMVYMLRTELGEVKKELDTAKKDIQKLFTAQQELEQYSINEKHRSSSESPPG